MQNEYIILFAKNQLLTNGFSHDNMNTERTGSGKMSKLYQIKEEYVEEWKSKLPPELFEEYRKNGFDVDAIVDHSREWDMGLQRVLDQVVIIKDDE